MPDAIITSTESTFGTISGTFAADQSTISGTILGPVAGNLSGSVGVPGPAGPGIPAGGLEGQIIVKASETDYDTVWVDNAAETLTATVRNETGATLTKGTVVYINGASGNKATVTKASASSESGSSKTFAILKDDILNNQNGTAVTVGLLKGVDTSAFSPGANLWLSTTAGQITQTPPTSPNHAVFLGNAVRIHANQGEIEVRIQNGYELGELHDVLIHDVANGQVLKYDSAQGLWVNGTDVGGVAWGGITGTLSDQTDLQSALDAKYDASNPSGYITSSALTGYATESFVTSQGYITSAALSPYLTSATAASTYQTLSGMSSYLTTSAAASTYLTQANAASTYYLQTNPAGYITSSALTGYATESFVTSQGYITSSALSPYLLSSTAASTYQTIAGMSSYLTTSAAASTYYPLTNPSGYITSSALAGYATESWVTSELGSYLTTADAATTYYPLVGNPSSFVNTTDIADMATQTWVTAGFYPLSSNPAGYLTSASLSGYATESWVTGQLGSYLTTSTAASTYAPLASPALTGNPTAPTPATADNDTSIATTAFVKAQGYLTSAPVTSVAGKTGAVTLVVGDVSGAAPLASPSLTGTPTAPTAAVDTNTTQLATTAYVVGQSYAKLASPALTGTPTAPTATAGTNTTQIATTAFVTAAVPAAATIAESLAPTPSSTAKFVSPATAVEMLVYPGYFQAYGLGNTNTSGTGASVFATNGSSRWHSVRGPNAGVAGHAFYIFDYSFSGIGVAAAKRGGSLYAKDWSRKIWVSGRSTIATWAETISGLAGDANTFARVMLGGRSSTGAGGMQAGEPGVGWKVAGGGSQALVLTVSNGSTLTEVTSSFTPVANQVFDWKIYSDGAGNVTLWVNETSVATSTAGPTTNNENYNFYCEVVDQTSSATAPFGLSNYGTKIFWSV